MVLLRMPWYVHSYCNDFSTAYRGLGRLLHPLPLRARFLLTLAITYIIYSLYMTAAPNLDATFSALADPTRRAILARLARGEATVMELAEPFEMTQPAISQHLKVLEDAGLIVRRVDGARRPRRLAKAGIDAMDQWLAMLRKALEKNYDRLDEVLAAMKPIRRRKSNEQADAETRR
jgi:DNA-binding transcriptional ArsR family regulator